MKQVKQIATQRDQEMLAASAEAAPEVPALPEAKEVKQKTA
jgi:hypothetical protein